VHTTGSPIIAHGNSVAVTPATVLRMTVSGPTMAGIRIFSLPVKFVGGQRRLQYGGYWFGLVDPWPEYWSNNWYDSDDMWVDYYAGGYYLCNRSHPGDRIAISFYLN
jgi:hypothetical protein